jgi:hypothetical protein
MEVMTRFVAATAIIAFLMLTGIAAAKIYPGTSQALMPSQREIGFMTLVLFKPAKTPSAALRKGYKNGVGALFEKGTKTAPVNVVITVYVYSSTASATLAWTHACSKCKVESAPQGIKLKAEAGTSSGLPSLHEVSRCGNVYLDVLEAGAESVSKLDSDVATVTNAVYVRAIHGGLSSCTTK